MSDIVQNAKSLKKNSIGLPHIVFFVVAAAAPLTAVVGATPAAFAAGNGAGVPGSFILAGILYLFFSAGFTAMSPFVTGAGAFYTYITQGLGKPLGVAGAMIAILTYNSVQIAVYALFAFFLSSALQPFGINLPWFVYSLGAVIIVTFCGQRNVSFSGNILGLCMIAEITILLLLDLAVMVHGGGPQGMNLRIFEPQTVFSPGLGVSLVFVIGSYIGFEATAIFSEEASDPARTIPRATYVAVLLITGFYAFSTWAITQYYGPAHIASVANANPNSMYFSAAAALLGNWASTTMNVLLITSLFACVLSFHNTINRYFFALGREGIGWSGMARVHAKHGSPSTAGLIQSAIAAVIILAFAVSKQDPYAVVFSWMATLAAIGILVVQVMVCIAVLVFFARDAHCVGLFRRLVAPAISGIGLAGSVALVVDNLSLLSGSSSAVVAAFPYIVLAAGLAGIGLALWLKTNRPQTYAALGNVFGQ